MASAIPSTVESLLAAADAAARDKAWAEFLTRYSGLILHVARSTRGDHDSVMDRYLFVLDALRKDDCRRLRAYSETGRGAFTTWLVAVIRRLCIDEHRRRFGRANADGPTMEQIDRRSLADLSGDETAPLEALESALASPDSEHRATTLKVCCFRDYRLCPSASFVLVGGMLLHTFRRDLFLETHKEAAAESRAENRAFR